MTGTVIIVGAPRSGTNMLRDVLTSLDGFTTWPCDEINPLWKHGNLDVRHDELTPAHARPEVAWYLRGQFAAQGQRGRAHTVVEKTCATSLRVAFAHAVFPDAKFVFIHRHGLDAAASTMKRWNAPFDLKYTLKKVRWAPPSDVPRHFASFASKKVGQLARRESGVDEVQAQVSTWWGPRPHDFEEFMRTRTLEELALIQWQRCVENSRRDLAEIPADQVHTVRYEDYCADPQQGTRDLLNFLGRPEAFRADAIAPVRTSSVGKGIKAFPPEVLDRMMGQVQPTLTSLGY